MIRKGHENKNAVHASSEKAPGKKERMMNMTSTIPGTTLPLNEQALENAFSQLRPILNATGGITLSQVSALTGIEGTTVQNWIKRGWIESTKGKKYTELQLVRIIIFNMLRDSMQLEKIATIMHYVNGEVDDRNDDILPDSDLYNLLCAVIFSAEKTLTADATVLQKIISEKTSGFAGAEKEKLDKALLIMSLAYISAQLKKRMESEYSKLS